MKDLVGYIAVVALVSYGVFISVLFWPLGIIPGAIFAYLGIEIAGTIRRLNRARRRMKGPP